MGGLTSLEFEHHHTDGQEEHDPGDSRDETQVDIGFHEVPASCEDTPEGRGGHGEGQTQTDVSQDDWHTFHGPDDTWEQTNKGVEEKVPIHNTLTILTSMLILRTKKCT